MQLGLRIGLACAVGVALAVGCGDDAGGPEADVWVEAQDDGTTDGEAEADADTAEETFAEAEAESTPVCGNGVLEGAEGCDDGNLAAGDGCADCVVEDGWECAGEPSRCEPVGDWFVAPDGDDAAAGDREHPFATLNRAWEVVGAGEVIWVRGGTYEFREQQRLRDRSGSASAPIRVLGYPGEVPVLSRGAGYAANVGVRFTGDHVHFRGLVFAGYEQRPVAEGGGNVSSGLRVEDSSHNVFERLECRDNGHGMVIVGASDDNLVLNSDFHHNQDPYTADDPYGNADGLELAYVPAGLTNTVRGCRFWWNTDDGIDLWENDGNVSIDGCWSWSNGFVPETGTPAGNGNGFKLGITTVDHGVAVLRTLTRCIAFDNRAHGFDQNGGLCSMVLHNNTAFRNGGAGFAFAYGESPMDVRNDVSYGNVHGEAFSAGSVVEHVSWDGSVTVSDEDFAGLDSSGVDGPRQPDGSLPELAFLRPAAGSDLIDAGVDVGLPFEGSAPDLGAFETAGE